MDIHRPAVLFVLMFLAGCASPNGLDEQRPEQIMEDLSLKTWHAEYRVSPAGMVQVAGVGAKPSASLSEDYSCVMLDLVGVALHSIQLESTWSDGARLNLFHFFKDLDGSPYGVQETPGPSPRKQSANFDEPGAHHQRLYVGTGLPFDELAAAGTTGRVQLVVNLQYFGPDEPVLAGAFNCDYLIHRPPLQ